MASDKIGRVNVRKQGGKLKHRNRAALLLCLAMAACGEAPMSAVEQTADVVPAAVAPSAPIDPFTVSRDAISFLDGRARLQMPAGWHRNPNPQPLLDIEADRYQRDLDRWAKCEILRMTAPNITTLDQDGLNMEVDRFSAKDLAALEADGIEPSVVYSMLPGNLRTQRLEFSHEGMDYFRSTFLVLDGMFVHNILMSCDTASPATGLDRSDIETLFGSFTIAPA